MSEIEGHTSIPIGSERSFGFLFAVIFLLLGIYLVFKFGTPGLPLFGLSVFLGVSAIFKPEWLATPNRLWFSFGLAIGSVVGFVVLMSVYVFVVLPIGLGMRIFRYDPMNRALYGELSSYWIAREEQPRTLKDQF